ncbi:MAG: PilZ domain-containing protein [Pseudobdellovibrionaceae bacterium]
MKSSHNIQRRRFPRQRIEAQVGVLKQSSFMIEKALEVSEGGMLLQSSQKMEIGQQLEVRFFLPNGAFVCAQSEVAYLLKPEPHYAFAGLRFTEVSHEVQVSIRCFVQKSHSEI